MRDLRLQLRSSYLGAITVAMLLVAAIEQLIVALEQPVSSLITGSFNFIIEHTPFWSLFPITHIAVTWDSTLVMAISAVLFGITAFGLALWLYAPDRD